MAKATAEKKFLDESFSLPFVSTCIRKLLF